MQLLISIETDFQDFVSFHIKLPEKVIKWFLYTPFYTIFIGQEVT